MSVRDWLVHARYQTRHGPGHRDDMAHFNRNDDFGACRISFRMATNSSGRTGKLAAGLSTSHLGSGAPVSPRRDISDGFLRLALRVCARLENCLVLHGAASDVDGEKLVVTSRDRWLASSFRMDSFVPNCLPCLRGSCASRLLSRRRHATYAVTAKSVE